MAKLSRREWVFAGIAALVIAAGALALSIMMAMTQGAESSARLWGMLVAILFGPGLLVAVASLAVFGVRGRIKNAVGLVAATFIVLLVAMLAMMASTGMLHAPRYLAYGKVRGTVEEVAARDAASVEITPAFVDIRRIGHASETSTDSKGRSHTTTRYVSPIVSASGERDLDAAKREPIVLFLCDSNEDDLRDAAGRSDAVTGRMSPAVSGVENKAIANVPDLVRGPGTPQCVVPGGGWSVFWVILWLQVMVLVVFGGGMLVLGIARPR